MGLPRFDRVVPLGVAAGAVGRAVGIARAGAAVVITSRNGERGGAAVDDIRARSSNEHVDAMTLDLASFASVRAFAHEFLERHPRLDVLVNNAGLVLHRRTETVD